MHLPRKPDKIPFQMRESLDTPLKPIILVSIKFD